MRHFLKKIRNLRKQNKNEKKRKSEKKETSKENKQKKETRREKEKRNRKKTEKKEIRFRNLLEGSQNRKKPAEKLQKVPKTGNAENAGKFDP